MSRIKDNARCAKSAEAQGAHSLCNGWVSECGYNPRAYARHGGFGRRHHRTWRSL